MKKKALGFICFTCCVALLFSGCGATETKGGVASTGAPWINSELIGNLPADVPAFKDDLYLAANYEWLSNSKIPGGDATVSAFSELADERKEAIEALFKDSSLTSHEAQLVQTFYNSYLDMDGRNAAGADPILPYTERILNIGSLEELTAFLCDSQYFPVDPLCIIHAEVDPKNNTQYLVKIFPAKLSLLSVDEFKKMTDEGKRRKEINDKAYVEMFKLIGCSETEAKTLNDAAFDVETQIAVGCNSDTVQGGPDYAELSYNIRTLDQLKEETSSFPLSQILAAKGYGSSPKYMVTELGWLKTLDGAYTEENLEGLKGLLLINLMNKSNQYLDQKFLDVYMDRYNAWIGAEGEKSLDTTAYDLTCNQFGPAVGKLYVENYFKEETKTDVTKMIDDIRSTFKARLEAADWLSPETLEKAVEKLDAMKAYVGYPEIWIDYTALTFPDRADGKQLFNELIQLYAFADHYNKGRIGTTVNIGEWTEVMPYEVNAFYNEKENSINIPAGILGGVFYDPEGSVETNMGGIGAVIGHEISHAFDTIGSQYDQNGNMDDWWTEEDYAAFKERTDKVVNYLGTIEALPGMFVNGEIAVGETVADLGSMACIIDMAKSIEDFDYEKFFKANANVWKRVNTMEYGTALMYDVHPMGYIRVNLMAQQSQEFYDTFGVKEGDGMYLAPEDRLKVW